MLSEGGIRVPMIISWPKKITTPQVIHEPVISLDFAPTILAAAGIAPDKILDGVSLIPLLSGEVATLPKRDLRWRFEKHAAIRAGDWKYYTISEEREMLFNLRTDTEEKHNLIKENPEMAKELKTRLSSWTNELQPPGMPSGSLSPAQVRAYDYYFGK
jgi:arylsulfatase A-like enzyme